MILVTGNITGSGDLANTKVAFKGCTPFKACRTEINDVLIMKQITFTLQRICII